MDAHVILVVGGTGEATATVGLRTGVGPLACVGAHMYLADIRCGKGAATALKRAPERAFTCADGGMRSGSGRVATLEQKRGWHGALGLSLKRRQDTAYQCGSGRASAGLLMS
jgi:hypothetical protein